MAEFDEARIKRIVALAEKAKADENKNWTAESIFERLDTAIIGNEKYKKSLAICGDFLFLVSNDYAFTSA